MKQTKQTHPTRGTKEPYRVAGRPPKDLIPVTAVSRLAARRLREARLDAGLTHAEVARLVGLTAQAFGDYERFADRPGRGTELSIDRLVELAGKLGVRVEWLLGLEQRERSVPTKIVDLLEALTEEQQRDVYMIARIYAEKKRSAP